MKSVVSACIGFALALSAYALSATPAAALEAPAVTAASQSCIVEVHYSWRERCRRVHYKCMRRYNWSRHRYHVCVARRGCGR